MGFEGLRKFRFTHQVECPKFFVGRQNCLEKNFVENGF